MRAIPVMLISAALGAGAIGTAVKMSPASASFASPGDWERQHAGPDSGRVAILLDALGKTDPVVCDLIGDQIGNFWWGDHNGIGRLAGAPAALQPAKDSIGGTVTDPRAIERLVAELHAPNACVRRVASKLLGRSAIGTARLSALLTDASPTVREAAALAAGTGEHRDVRTTLEKGLDDRDPAVGAMSAWALGEIEDHASLAPLRNAVRSTEPRVRLSAIWALGQLEDERAVSDVLMALMDADGSIRAMAAEVLGKFEKTETIAPLERVLARDADARVRSAAAEALGQIKAPSSAPALGKALGDADITVRRAAAAALGDLDELHEAPTGLVAAVKSDDPELRHRAAKSLCSIADPTTTATLLGFLSDGNVDLRKDAVEALGHIGTPAAISGITRALNDKDPQVRRAAVEALGESKDRG